MSINQPLILARCQHPIIEQVYTQKRVPMLDNSTKPLDIYIPREEGDYLYSLVRAYRPTLTVEVGMANGLSTLFIAQALADNGAGRHIAIDPFQSTDWSGAGIALLRLAGVSQFVEVIEQPSHQALPELERNGLKAQFIFIDGNHLFDYVLTDFLCGDRILEVGGLMVFDDSDWPAINQVLRFIVSNRSYKVAHPEVVIEHTRHTPTFSGRLLRQLGKLIPALESKLRPDFVVPSYNLGVRGRCVALKKMADDTRDSQSRYHQLF